MGIPLTLIGVDNSDKISFPSRDPTVAVYIQVVADLNMAMERLPETAGTPGRASYYAAVAYLAEITFFIFYNPHW